MSALTTAHADQLVSFGVIELNFIAILALVGVVARWQLAHMVIGFRPVNFTIGDFFTFLIQLLICSVMLHYYNSPLPGGLNLHQLPQAVGGAIANTLDTSVVDDLLTRVSAVIDGTAQPSVFNEFGIIVYMTIMLFMALVDLAMFAVDAFGYVGYGIFALFGPLMIPLYMTRNFASKFWSWLDGFIVFGMYRAVSAALTYVWLHVLIGFFDNTVAGDYSIGHWIAILATLVMLCGAFVWSMFKVPMLTSMLFGGAASGAQAATDAMVGTAARAIAAVAL